MHLEKSGAAEDFAGTKGETFTLPFRRLPSGQSCNLVDLVLIEAQVLVYFSSLRKGTLSHKAVPSQVHFCFRDTAYYFKGSDRPSDLLQTSLSHLCKSRWSLIQSAL